MTRCIKNYAVDKSEYNMDTRIKKIRMQWLMTEIRILKSFLYSGIHHISKSIVPVLFCKVKIKNFFFRYF